MDTDSIIVNAGKSEIAFELVARSVRAPGVYVVYACHHRPSLKLPSADAMVGMEFTAGDNPDFYPIGYARTIQRALNAKVGRP